MSKLDLATGASLIAVGSLLVVASAAAQQTPPARQALRFTIPPGAQSSVVIQTRPMASCTVRPSEGDSQKSVARFFADQRGIAQFFVKPEASGQATARFSIHCATTGHCDRL